MFRISFLVFVSLIFGIMAKPYKRWNKLSAEAFQDTLMSVDARGKVAWRKEIEPHENMDETQEDIDPKMMIWKSMTNNRGGNELLKAEEDLDDLYHPSMVELREVENAPEDENTQVNHFPEEDKDNIDHPGFGGTASEEPMQDLDEVYSRAELQLREYLAPLGADYKAEELQFPKQQLLKPEVRRHLEPEEDMDALYHADLKPSHHHHEEAQGAAPAESPVNQSPVESSFRLYSEPEEDLDHLYHL